jgi:hypothetical protein
VNMNGYFGIGKAKNNSPYIPKLGEVIQYCIGDDEWEIRIGDGKKMAKDLPHLYDIYERVSILEDDIQKLKSILYSKGTT